MILADCFRNHASCREGLGALDPVQNVSEKRALYARGMATDRAHHADVRRVGGLEVAGPNGVVSNTVTVHSIAGTCDAMSLALRSASGALPSPPRRINQRGLFSLRIERSPRSARPLHCPIAGRRVRAKPSRRGKSPAPQRDGLHERRPAAHRRKTIQKHCDFGLWTTSLRVVVSSRGVRPRRMKNS